MLEILKLGDNAKLGRPAWYELGQNGIAHYVPDIFPIDDIPETLCKRKPNQMTDYPLMSGELIDPEDESEGFIPMCKICLRKLI